MRNGKQKKTKIQGPKAMPGSPSCAGQVVLGAAGRWLVQRPACVRGPCGRQMSQGGKLPDARSLYRDLLRAVRAFPAEPMLDLNDSGGEQSFAVVASIQIRCTGA